MIELAPDSFDLGGWSNYIGKRFELHYSDGQILDGVILEGGFSSRQGLEIRFDDFINDTCPVLVKILIED